MLFLNTEDRAFFLYNTKKVFCFFYCSILGNTYSASAVPRILPKLTRNDGLAYKLKNDPECKDDIADYCVKEAKEGGNFALLVCLQNQIKVVYMYIIR